jgi:hypothetical protein
LCQIWPTLNGTFCSISRFLIKFDRQLFTLSYHITNGSSLDRLASSASVIWFERLLRDHQLSWLKNHNLELHTLFYSKALVFHSKTTGKEYNIFCNVNCKTPNVVYLIDCHVCGSQYVGESVQPFNKRMNGRRSDLTKKTLLPVSKHFVSSGHSLDVFGRSKIYTIDHNPSWKENQRQK